MAILRSIDGQFYNVPDSQLNAMLVPAEQVKAKLNAEASSSMPEAAHNAADGDDQVTPHGRCGWRNCWSRNCWRNCWRNCYGH
jgi:hypothetical protein